LVTGRLTLSIVSHRQAALVYNLLNDVKRLCSPAQVEVIVTVNVPETLPFSLKEFPFETVVLSNGSPKGFGANHNAAARRARGEFFCVLNPDIRIRDDPFPILLRGLQDKRVGVVAPKILDPEGATEDSARKFPTLISILKKALGLGDRLDYEIGDSPMNPDWVAGMFMLFRSEVFQRVGGFDEHYFLYYEDVDLCLRLRRLGYDVLLDPRADALHDAQRASRRDLQHLCWHARSLVRFLWSRGIGHI
jgi:N-acetylglucosaminyl-diphospho-decaprenol L-rhamnosyltransferase